MIGYDSKAAFEAAITEAVRDFAESRRTIPAAALRAARSMTAHNGHGNAEPKWVEYHFDTARRARSR